MWLTLIIFQLNRIDGPEFGKRKQEGKFPYGKFKKKKKDLFFWQSFSFLSSGSVPVLTVGDVTVAQSNNILRYCGVKKKNMKLLFFLKILLKLFFFFRNWQSSILKIICKQQKLMNFLMQLKMFYQRFSFVFISIWHFIDTLF